MNPSDKPSRLSIRSKLQEIEPKIEEFSLAKTLEAKLDYAYEVYLMTSELLADLKDIGPSIKNNLGNPSSLDITETEHQEVLRALTTLQNNTLDFMQIMLDVKTKEQVQQLAEIRRQMKIFDPAFLPRGEDIAGVKTPDPDFLPHGENSSEISAYKKRRAQYNWQRLARLAVALDKKKIMRVNDESRKLDKEKRTIYLDHERRALHRILLKNGIFYQPGANIELNFDKRKMMKQFEKCSTDAMVSHNKMRYAAYVINAQGEIALFEHYNMLDRYAHSSMFAGASVFGAGEIKIINGKLQELTTHSGHYRPSLENVYQVLKYFQSQGVDIHNVQIRHFEAHPDIPSINRSFEGPPGFYFQARAIISWGDNLNLQQEGEKLELKTDALKEKVQSLKIKEYEQSDLAKLPDELISLQAIAPVLESLEQEVASLIKALEPYNNNGKSKQKITAWFKKIWHSWIGQGSYQDMKKDQATTATEMIKELTTLQENIKANLALLASPNVEAATLQEELKQAAQGKLAASKLNKLLNFHSSVKRAQQSVQTLRDTTESAKIKFETQANNIKQKYRRDFIPTKKQQWMRTKLDKMAQTLPQNKSATKERQQEPQPDRPKP